MGRMPHPPGLWPLTEGTYHSEVISRTERNYYSIVHYFILILSRVSSSLHPELRLVGYTQENELLYAYPTNDLTVEAMLLQRGTSAGTVSPSGSGHLTARSGPPPMQEVRFEERARTSA